MAEPVDPRWQGASAPERDAASDAQRDAARLAGQPAAGPPPDVAPGRAESRRRPILERIGLLGISAVFAVLFAAMAAAAWVGGEPFLAVLAALGGGMTVWVGLVTLLRS